MQGSTLPATATDPRPMRHYGMRAGAWTWPLILSAMWVHLAACAAPAIGPAPPPQTTANAGPLRYRVQFNDTLSVAKVQLCFDGDVPRLLVPGELGAVAHLLSANGPLPSPRALAVDDRGIQLQGLSQGDCIEYQISLRDNIWRGPNIRSFYAGRSGRFLWRPPRAAWSDDMSATLQVKLPKNNSIATPFEEKTSQRLRYHLDRSAFAYSAPVAVGAIRWFAVARSDCDMRAAVLPGLDGPLEAAILAHLEKAATAVTSVLGRFPARRLQVLVIPAGPGNGQAIRFGQLTRGGAPTVTLLVSTDAQAEQIQDEWTVVHEFSHMFLPFVQRSDAWLSEGMATYYQEVLRVRGGLQTPEAGFARLVSGVSKARASNQTLARESHEMFESGHFPMVYWGGATFVWLADMALRTRSGGTQTLDMVLRRLPRTPARSEMPASAATLLAQLDRASGSQLFTSLARQVVYQGRLPQLDGNQRAYGIPSSDSPPRLPTDGPLRDALTPTQPPTLGAPRAADSTAKLQLRRH